jgi:hypothetical protein
MYPWFLAYSTQHLMAGFIPALSPPEVMIASPFDMSPRENVFTWEIASNSSTRLNENHGMTFVAWNRGADVHAGGA